MRQTASKTRAMPVVVAGSGHHDPLSEVITSTCNNCAHHNHNHHAMKGNNGKAARKRFQRQLNIATGCLTVLCLTGYWWHKDQIDAWLYSDPSTTNRYNKNKGILKSKRNNNNKKNNMRGSIFNYQRQQHPNGMANGKGYTLLNERTDVNHPAWHDILTAKSHLIDVVWNDDDNHNTIQRPNRDLDVHDYNQMYAIYCQLDWSVHKKDPSSVPMFRDLVQKSNDCLDVRIKVPMKLLMERIQQHDAAADTTTKILDLQGVAFHESRCGSTLVANLLARMYPEQHRVYSESAPPITVMLMLCPDTGDDDHKCISDPRNAQLFQNVIYLMRRSNDPLEQRVFFKIQSVGSLHLPFFQHAFPDTPWIYVYRDPVQVMMSHLKVPNIRTALCVRKQSQTEELIPAAVKNILYRQYPADQPIAKMNPVDYCAAHLASLTETAARALQAPNSRGTPVPYSALPDALWETVVPNMFHVPVDDAAKARMQRTAQEYSKGRARPKATFQEDSTAKEAAASPGIKQAAATFLDPSYQQLQQLATAAGIITSPKPASADSSSKEEEEAPKAEGDEQQQR